MQGLSFDLYDDRSIRRSYHSRVRMTGSRRSSSIPLEEIRSRISEELKKFGITDSSILNNLLDSIIGKNSGHSCMENIEYLNPTFLAAALHMINHFSRSDQLIDLNSEEMHEKLFNLDGQSLFVRDVYAVIRRDKENPKSYHNMENTQVGEELLIYIYRILKYRANRDTDSSCFIDEDLPEEQFFDQSDRSDEEGYDEEPFEEDEDEENEGEELDDSGESD